MVTLNARIQHKYNLTGATSPLSAITANTSSIYLFLPCACSLLALSGVNHGNETQAI